MYISKNKLKDRQGERLFVKKTKKDISIYGYIPKKIVYDQENKSNAYNYYVDVLDLPNLGLTIDPIMGNGVEVVHKTKPSNKIIGIFANGIKSQKSPEAANRWSGALKKVKNDIKIKVKSKFMINKLTTETKQKLMEDRFCSGSKSLRNFARDSKQKTTDEYMVKDSFARFNCSKTTRLTNDVSGVTSRSFFNSRLNTLKSAKKDEVNFYDIDLSTAKKTKNADSGIFDSGIFSRNNQSQSQNIKHKVRFARGEKAKDRIKGYSVRSSNSSHISASRRKQKDWRSSSTIVHDAVKRARMRIRGRGGLKKSKSERKKAPEKLSDFLTYTKLDAECKYHAAFFTLIWSIFNDIL